MLTKNRNKYEAKFALVVMSQLLCATMLLSLASIARAVPVDPPLGYLPDTGVSYFVPGGDVIAVELADALEPATAFGFFFQSTPETLIPIFDSTDLSSSESQIAQIFLAGLVSDIDAGIAETLFTPSTDDIGLYLSVAGVTLYSDPALNVGFGGLDLFSAFQSTSNPLEWIMVFEGIDATGGLIPISVNLLGPLSTSTVSSPASFLLVGSVLPFLLALGRRRRKDI